MTLGGWIIMLISVASVTSLFCWCIYKVLLTPEQEGDIHRFEIETPDTEHK